MVAVRVHVVGSMTAPNAPQPTCAWCKDSGSHASANGCPVPCEAGCSSGERLRQEGYALPRGVLLEEVPDELLSLLRPRIPHAELVRLLEERELDKLV